MQGIDLSQELSWLKSASGLYTSVLVACVLLVLIVTVLVTKQRRRRREMGPDLTGSEQQEIEALEASGAFRLAGRRWEETGHTRRALRAYQQGRAHLESARLLKQLGKPKQALREAKAAGDWQLFAEIAEEAGKPKAAAKAWLRARRPSEAAHAFEAAGARLEAAKCWLAVGEAQRALDTLGDDRDPRAAELLHQALYTEKVAPGQERTEILERAIGLYLEHDEPQAAFDLALAEGRTDLAIRIAREHLPPSPDVALACEQAGDPSAAAEIYEAMGDLEKAALLRGDVHAAAQDHAAAAAAYEKAGDWRQAGDHWVADNDLERAAAALERAGSWGKAARLWGEAGVPERRANALVRRDEEESLRQSQPVNSGGLEPTVAAAPTSRPPPAIPPSVSFELEPTRELTQPSDERYEIRDELGRGGMGIVYRAWDLLLERQVAFKVLHGTDNDAVEDLLAEARAAARLSHPNIVTVYDAGRHLDRAFIVMELIEGRTFADLLPNKLPSVTGTINVARQICAALRHAHGKQIVHRDLKPSNLLWLDEDRLVKLTDFGLARQLEESGAVMTQAAGTPSYMAPEQIKGEPIAPSTDLYSLACVLYELLTGAPPFPRKSSLYDHLSTEPTDPSEVNESIPPSFAALILQCMRKDPDDRPQSAAAVDSVLATI